jgi:hypothetical protein
MTFSDPFRSPFVPPISSPGGVATPWYLLGNVTLAQCVAAYAFKNAASYATAKINLAHPSVNDCADGTAYPTWASATGCTFDGSTQYLTTGIIPTSVNFSIFIQYTNLTGTANYTLIGSYATATKAHLIAPNFAGNVMNFYNGGVASNAPILAGGNYGLAGHTAYRNGISETNVSSGTGLSGLSLTIGGLNYSTENNIVQFSNFRCVAVAVFNIIHPVPLTLSAAMAAL